jgi:23S rRNA (pseudouridine1915-N3)-methyltransferase
LRLSLVVVGRLKAGPERELAARYAERAAPLARNLGFGALEIVELAEGRARRDKDRKAEEAAAILARCAAGVVIACDERGANLASTALAGRLARWRDAGEPHLHFVVGGPDGLDETVRARAALTLAFGTLTLPHQLVRVLVAEQVYRAMTILGGHPYHRA